MRKASPFSRLLAKIEPQPNGCWYFAGSLNKGHGQLRFEGTTVMAHRVAYEGFVGPIPPGMTIDHECHNLDKSCRAGDACLHRRCVNPDHLVPRPIKENTLAGRLGEFVTDKVAMAQLASRYLTGETTVQLAAAYGVSDVAIAYRLRAAGVELRPSPAAIAAQATHCVNGHEFTAENTYTYGGKRSCRMCRRLRNRAADHARRARRNAAQEIGVLDA